jgi:transcriptional regulator GlxA family with amidase domain
MSPSLQSPHLIAVLAFEGVQLLDVAGPVQTFASANEIGSDGRGTPYRVVVVSRRGGAVCTSSGLPLVTRAISGGLKGSIDTLLIPGGPGVHEALKDARLVAWVRRQSSSARRIASICTGAFLLAQTGLLAGRRATTHWKSCSRLQQSYPDIMVDPDPIYLHEGRIWTSAGVTAGIDLSLALVQEDLGRSVAMQVARQPRGVSQTARRPVAIQRATAGAGHGGRSQRA